MSSPPVVEVALEPKTKGDHEKMGVALSHLAREDPNFRVTTHHEYGQTIIKGMSELHLEILVDRMKREFKVEAEVGAPQIAYRETLAKAVEVDYSHKKHTGPSYQFGRVRVRVAPGESGSGVQFFNEIKGGNIPREHIPWIEKGMRHTAEAGSLIGFPIIDFEIHLIDGAYHDIDSSPMAFEIAGRGAMREAAQKAGIKLLEPIMKVEVVTPEEYVGDVIGDLNSRGGQIEAIESCNSATIVEGSEKDRATVVATAPMANLFGFEKHLKSLTGDEAPVSMVFERHELVPGSDNNPDDTFPVAAALRA